MNSVSRSTAGELPYLLKPGRPQRPEMSHGLGGDVDSKTAGMSPLALQSAMCRAALRDPRLYRQRFVWKLRGKVDRLLLRQAWDATLRRHEIFSLAMSRDDGNDLFFTKREGSCLVWIEREADAVAEPVGEARSGFGDESLEHQLQQVTLVRRPGDRWKLHGLSHHAWMDGRSRRIDGADHNGLVGPPYFDRWMRPFSAEIERSLAGA